MNKLKTDWQAIKAEYINGAKSGELMEKYGIAQGALSSQIRRGQWRLEKAKLSQIVVEKMTEKTVNALTDLQLECKRRQESTATDILRAIEPKLRDPAISTNELYVLTKCWDLATKHHRQALDITDYGEGARIPVPIIFKF